MQPLASAPPTSVRYRGTGLYAVPSIHGRGAFAQAVHEACYNFPFDVIAVELPAALQGLGVTEKVCAFGDRTGLVVVPDGRTVAVSAPDVDDPSGPAELRIAERGLVVPVSPCDSIITALRAPGLLRHRWPRWQPEIVYVDADPVSEESRCRDKPPELIEHADDYLVNREGLPEFYNGIELSIQSLRTARDEYREQVMAARLQRLLQSGKTIVFVGGAAHLKNIFTLVGTGVDPARASDPVPKTSRLGTPVSLLLDPALAYAQGYLDDAPQLAWQWVRHCQAARTTRFDKAAAVELLLELGTLEASAASVRAILTWRQYLFSLLATQGRWIPRVRDLVHSARACVGLAFAENLRRLAMEYPPNADAQGTPSTVLIPQANGELLVGCRRADKVEDRYYLVDLQVRWKRGPSDEDGFPLYAQGDLQMTERKRRALRGGYVHVAAPVEQALARRLANHARVVAHRRLRNPPCFYSREFRGEPGWGLDFRGSIRAMLQGKPHPLVRHRKRSRSGHEHCDGGCPLVWIFKPQARVTKRQAGYVPWDSPRGEENVYSAFYWFSTRKPIGRTSVIRSTTAWALHLLNELAPGEREKYNRLLATFPDWRRCRVSPWEDKDLRQFKESQLAVAAAIKYAPHHVVVVTADPEWRPSTEVNCYAAQRGIRLLILSASEFDPAVLERYQRDHEVPAPATYEPPFPFALEFVEPVEV